MTKMIKKSTTTPLHNHKGFTLAETLITLVIIGIVAALTVPAMINNHRKAFVETRLKSAYSILANMFKAAEADYGTFGTWDLSEFTGQTNSVSVQTNAFIDKYMIPYLRVAKDTKQTFEEYGYKAVLYPNGNTFMPLNWRTRFITLANGMTLWVDYGGKILNNGNEMIHDVFIDIDIDGPYKGPNTLAKDIFIFHQPLVNGYPLTVVGERSSNTCTYANMNAQSVQNYIQTNKCTLMINRNTGAIIFTNFLQSRDEILENCKKGNYYTEQCGALIRIDGWKISKDYPWL